MANKSAADAVFDAVEKAATDAIGDFKRLGISIEYDKRGKHPSMTIRVIPAVKIKRSDAKGEPA